MVVVMRCPSRRLYERSAAAMNNEFVVKSQETNDGGGRSGCSRWDRKFEISFSCSALFMTSIVAVPLRRHREIQTCLHPRDSSNTL